MKKLIYTSLFLMALTFAIVSCAPASDNSTQPTSEDTISVSSPDTLSADTLTMVLEVK